MRCRGCCRSPRSPAPGSTAQRRHERLHTVAPGNHLAGQDRNCFCFDADGGKPPAWSGGIVRWQVMHQSMTLTVSGLLSCFAAAGTVATTRQRLDVAAVVAVSAVDVVEAARWLAEPAGAAHAALAAGHADAVAAVAALTMVIDAAARCPRRARSGRRPAPPRAVGRTCAGKTSNSGIGTGCWGGGGSPSRPTPARWRWAACTPSCWRSRTGGAPARQRHARADRLEPDHRRHPRERRGVGPNEGLIEQSPARFSVHVYRLVWPQMILFAPTIVSYGVGDAPVPRPTALPGISHAGGVRRAHGRTGHHRCPGLPPTPPAPPSPLAPRFPPINESLPPPAPPAPPTPAARPLFAVTAITAGTEVHVDTPAAPSAPSRRPRRYRRRCPHCPRCRRQPPAARSLRGQSRGSHHRQSSLRATS